MKRNDLDNRELRLGIYTRLVRFVCVFLRGMGSRLGKTLTDSFFFFFWLILVSL
jgi:hypothetical protein